MDRPKIIYIAGWGRSGSTLLGNMLGQLDGVFACGEIMWMWDRNLGDQMPCGCGQPIGRCPVWSSILPEALEGVSIEGTWESLMRVTRERHALRRRARLSRHLAEEPGTLATTLAKLYRTIGERTSARVIVDASKVPMYGDLLTRIPQLDVAVVHLVRDPRAVAYSWKRVKYQADVGRNMKRRRAVDSAWRWAARNLEAGWLSRRGVPFVQLRHEDVLRDPQRALEIVMDLVGEQVIESPVRGRTVEMGPTHTTSGNPERFATGLVELRSDEAWYGKLSPRERALTGLTAWPVARRYGYPLHARSPERIAEPRV